MSREIPQFVSCGLELGNCPRQIPYDMANHDKKIRDEVIEEFIKGYIDDTENYDGCKNCTNQEDYCCIKCYGKRFLGQMKGEQNG